MTMKFLTISGRAGFSLVMCSALMLGIASFDGAAQSKQRLPVQDAWPRVGTIKNYPATGLMTGCGNLYFYPIARANPQADAYIFLASGDGSNAWMNLGGRDVRLQQIKLSARKNRRPQRYDYRWGTLRISVEIEDFKPETAPVVESDSMFKMKITLRRGRAVHIVRAVGDSDC